MASGVCFTSPFVFKKVLASPLTGVLTVCTSAVRSRRQCLRSQEVEAPHNLGGLSAEVGACEEWGMGAGGRMSRERSSVENSGDAGAPLA